VIPAATFGEDKDEVCYRVISPAGWISLSGVDHVGLIME